MIFLIIAAAGFTQTKTFRTYLRSTVLQELHSVVRGTIMLGDIQGNLATGFSVNDVGVFSDGREVLFAERLEVRYDPALVFFGRITLSRVTLLRPRIHLWRGENGAWNLENLLVTSAEPDTAPSPWVIDLKMVELLGARARIIDSLALNQRTAEETAALPAQAFDFSNLSLDPLTLKAGVRIAENQISANIRSLDFTSDHPTFRLEQLSGEFTLGPRMAEVRRLTIRTTKSRLSLNARLRGVDLLAIGDLDELEKAPVDLALTVDKLDFGEFKRFLPGPVDFLDTQAAFDIRASGPFGRLSVEEIAVKTPRSFVRIKGSLHNLHRPGDLELDVTANDNILHPSDLLDLLPGLHLPDLRTFGVLSYDLEFKGKLEQFKASGRGRLSAGTFSVESELDLRGPSMVYKGNLATAEFDLGTLLNDKDLTSRLNVRGIISGAGTSPKSMTTLVRLQADSSEFLGLPISNSVLVVDVADRSLRSNLLLIGGQTRVDLNVRSGFARDDSLTYDLRGKVFSLNLAQILQDRRYESDLSFNVQMAGTNLDFESMKARAGVQFLRSSFGNQSFENQDVVLDYGARDDATRELVLNSDIADLQIRGAFTPPSFVTVVSRGSEILAEALVHRFSTLDSLRGRRTAGPRPAFVSRGIRDSDSIDADFSIDVKDFHPLGVFLGEPMAGQATLQGSVHGSLGDLKIDGTASVVQFGIASGTTVVDLRGTDAAFDVSRIAPRNTIENLRSSIRLTANSILVDSVQFSNVDFMHELIQDSALFSISTLVDSTIGVNLAGTSVFVPNLIELTISRLGLEVAEHAFENADTIRAQFGKDGVKFADLIMQHETEELTLGGILDPTGVSDLQFSVRNFLLNNLKDFSLSPAYVERVRDFNGILDLDGSFHGNVDRPAFNVTVSAQGVRVGPAVFGTITGRGSYADGLADVFLEFRSRPDEPNVPSELFVSGVMPLSLGTVSPTRDDFGMDLVIRARGFRLEFLDPFIPVTSNLTGQVFADMKMRGTIRQPMYEGNLNLQNGRFFFTPLGITYILNGRLNPQGQEIVLQEMSLANIPNDGASSMSLSGNLVLAGFDVKGFDIVAQGQLLVMKEASRLPGLPLYGNVSIASGPTPLQWTGTPERSFVTGSILVRNANITFPPTGDIFLERETMFTVTFIDDTSHLSSTGQFAGGKGPAAANFLPGSSMLPSNGKNLLPSLPVALPRETSFLDNIVYSLAIETAGLTQVRFVFNQLTNEELFADLKGRLVFARDGGTSRLTGELEVGQRSYYKYFKTLQASGKLLFTGNVANPELDIIATYEGLYSPVDTTKEDQKVIVRLAITGTRDEPKVKMGLEVYDRDGNKLPQRADVQSDAIAFLVSGTFKDEMTQQQETSLTSNLLRSISSSLLTAPLTDFVRSRVGYVTSIDVAYYGGSKSFQESADLRVTGEVGEYVIRLGGRVFQDVSNTNVSVQFPMSAIVGSEAWRNLVLELERRVEGVESFERRRDSKGVRLLYRITF